MDEFEAEVVDISPILCPKCRSVVSEEDAYCEGCGTNLLEPLTRLCPKCGKALSQTSSYCSGCGTAVTSEARVQTTELPASPPIDVERTLPFDESDWGIAYDEADREAHTASPDRKRRRKRWPYALLAAVIVLSGAGAGWWYGYRQPDLKRFADQLDRATELALSSQETTDSLEDPSDLDGFSAEIDDVIAKAEELDGETGDVIDAGRRSALENIVVAQLDYFSELDRLSELPSAEAQPSEYVRARELAGEVEATFAQAKRYDATLEVPAISPSPLTAVLSDLAAYRKEVLKERARAREINKERAAELAEVNAFTDQLDGIVSRYSSARGELSEWIDNVDQYGSSFNAAYSKLDQQVELRNQLRSELAALTPPDPFGADQAALLAVMDRAVTATQDAYRGIEEFQFDFNYRYLYYYDTPGWRSFEAQTDEISDSYEAALAAYESRKTDVVKRLEKRVPLPELPD